MLVQTGFTGDRDICYRMSLLRHDVFPPEGRSAPVKRRANAHGASSAPATGEPAAGRIAPPAADAIRAAIAEVGGREVFFACKVNGEGMVVEARTCARGHDSAVPAVSEMLEKGEVVLHNHPTGDVTPSEADIQLAAIYGFNGHGIYITDNEVSRVYVVVEPLLSRPRALLDARKLTQTLAPDGRLAAAIPEFEVRPQQVTMLSAVADAFNNDGIAVVEAPTGVGKTVAYLLPAAAWALKNRERVVISTKTINLQEQIVLKDVPVIEKALGRQFSAVLVKGRSNYLCWSKLERALTEVTLFQDEGDKEQFDAIADWARHTKDGSLADLPFVPRRDVWSRVCSESDTCRMAGCKDFKRCFVGAARRELAKADLIVANHHMLFSDLNIKKETGAFTSLAVLPAYSRVIFDEAHSIEDSATEYFGVDVTRNGAMALFGRFISSERGRERGLLPYLKARLVKGETRETREAVDGILNVINDQLLPAISVAREGLKVAFDVIRDYVAERCGKIGRDIKYRLTEPVLAEPALRQIHAEFVLQSVEEIGACVGFAMGLENRLRLLNDELPTRPYDGDIAELQAYTLRLRTLANTLAEGTSEALAPNTVRWVEIDGHNKTIVRIIRAPLHVAKPLAEWVYPNLKTVVMTSATLSVRQRFDYFKGRNGLNLVKDRPLNEVILDSPFDFERQALLCIPTDTSMPDEKAFLEETVDLVRQALKITRGHAFVLFTSFYALDYTHKRLQDELEAAGIAALKQGQSTRTQLLERFRSDAASVLFATDSFWEGVDVAGEALQCVILPKLPFRVPTEPVLEARTEAIEAAGGNAFMEYTVPQAVIKFRQGFGRLIRRRTDAGAVIVLDKRVVARHYGATFLQSLPGVRIVKGNSEAVFIALRQFFERKGQTS